MKNQYTLARELHAPRRIRFPTRSVVLESIDDLWQADLVEMGHLAKWNRGHRYLLTVIDTFSKFGFARPLKTKKGEEVTTAFNDILKTSKRIPKLLQTDQGKEFFNTKFQTLMKAEGIHHYHTFTDKKASIVERWNRTLKSHMYRNFTERNSLRWIDSLSRLVNTYNHLTHGTIGMKPARVKKSHENTLWERIHKTKTKHKDSNLFRVGDIVRVSRVKSIFGKGYTPNWTEELFKIATVIKTNPRTYRLEDLLGERIRGTFYGHEMRTTRIPDYARIEKVISRKTLSDGTKMIRVKWKGYDSRFNQWIREADSQKL